MVSIADYQATGRCFVPLALNDRFPAILNAQNPAIPSAHPQMYADAPRTFADSCIILMIFMVRLYFPILHILSIPVKWVRDSLCLQVFPHTDAINFRRLQYRLNITDIIPYFKTAQVSTRINIGRILSI